MTKTMLVSLALSIFALAGAIGSLVAERRRRRSHGALVVRRWLYRRDGLFDSLLDCDCRTLRADAPCGGVLLARVRKRELEDAVSGPEAEFGIVLGALLVRCPFDGDGRKAFDCPLFDHAHDAAFGIAVKPEDAATGRAQGRAVELKWFPSVVPDCKLPPFAPLAVANKPNRKRCLLGLHAAAVLHVPSAELKEYLRRDAEDGERGKDERSGLHAAESSRTPTGCHPARRNTKGRR